MKKILLVGLGVFSLSGITMAGEAMKTNTDNGFTALDIDKNGTLSQAETKSNPTASENFASLDTDKDGNLSKAEFDAMNALTQAN